MSHHIVVWVTAGLIWACCAGILIACVGILRTKRPTIGRRHDRG